MKSKLRNLLLAAMALTLFAGCSNIALNDAAVEGSDAGDKCMLTISVAGLTGNGSIIERTIDPKKYEKGKNTTFKIEGISARNVKLKIGETEAADGLYGISFDSAGKANLALDYDVWYLTLHAYESNEEVLRGVTTVDLTKTVENNTIAFILSTKGVTTDGGLAITVTGITPAVKSYKAGLYDINTDECKYLLGDTDVEEDDRTTGITFSENKNSDATEENKSKIAPGSYIFKFIPYNDTKANASTREDLTPYSDVVTIAPGRTTTGNVSLSIMQPPASPTGFTVSLVDDSENDGDDYYVVRLNWADNSSNEENFVLRIYELTSATANLPDSPLVTFDNSAKSTSSAKKFMDGNAYHISGTLGMSTKTCEVMLPTGHLYEMTLSAKNRAGESAVCTRTLEPGDNPKFGKKRTDTEGNVITDAYGNEEYDLYRINRQKITYNFMGGTRIIGTNKSDGTGEDIDSTDLNKIVYRTYDGTAYTLMVIKNTGYAVDDPDTIDVNEATNTDKLNYNDHPWSKWTTLPNAGDDITAIAANSFADTMVYASYNQNINVTYSVADEYRTLDVSWTCDATGATADTDNNKLVLNVTTTPTVTGGSIAFNIAKSFTPYGENNPVSISTLNKIIVIINGGKPVIRDGSEIVSDASNYKYLYSLNNFRTSGVYNITIIGEIDGHYYSGAPIALTVDIK